MTGRVGGIQNSKLRIQNSKSARSIRLSCQVFTASSQAVSPKTQRTPFLSHDRILMTKESPGVPGLLVAKRAGGTQSSRPKAENSRCHPERATCHGEVGRRSPKRAEGSVGWVGGNPKSEIPNPKWLGGRHSEFRTPNSEFIPGLAPQTPLWHNLFPLVCAGSSIG